MSSVSTTETNTALETSAISAVADQLEATCAEGESGASKNCLQRIEQLRDKLAKTVPLECGDYDSLFHRATQLLNPLPVQGSKMPQRGRRREGYDGGYVKE